MDEIVEKTVRETIAVSKKCGRLVKASHLQVKHISSRSVNVETILNNPGE